MLGRPNTVTPALLRRPPAQNYAKQGSFGRQKVQTFITRLHVRYNRDRFAEDLIFQEPIIRACFKAAIFPTKPTAKLSTVADKEAIDTTAW